MKIGFAHFRVGETDGVSLEMDKWKLILEKMNHEVIYIAGESTLDNVRVIEELHYMSDYNNVLVDVIYKKESDALTEEECKKIIEEKAKVIESKLINIIESENLDILVPNNILSLGWNLPAGIGFANAIKKTNIKTIMHNHDFFWERELYSNPKFDFVNDLLLENFPPKGENIKCVTINTLATKYLLKEFNYPSEVVPNVFNFDGNTFNIDEYNKDFKKDIGLLEDDICILQATRVTNRKAIELAIDLLSMLNNNKFRSKMLNKKMYNGKVFTEKSRFVLVLAGLNEGFDNYVENLNNHAKEKGVKLLYCNNRVEHERCFKDNIKMYSLWDAYVFADIVTYPSVYEGFGNQFLEGVYANKPQVTFEYSVFESDIKKYNFNYISLGNEYTVKNNLVKVKDSILENASLEFINYLFDKDYRDLNMEKNYNIAYKYLSYNSLYKILGNIFNLGGN